MDPRCSRILTFSWRKVFPTYILLHVQVMVYMTPLLLQFMKSVMLNVFACVESENDLVGGMCRHALHFPQGNDPCGL
ncbi:hypothetical protein FKM82_025024 [Ascaphus truei]